MCPNESSLYYYWGIWTHLETIFEVNKFNICYHYPYVHYKLWIWVSYLMSPYEDRYFHILAYRVRFLHLNIRLSCLEILIRFLSSCFRLWQIHGWSSLWMFFYFLCVKLIHFLNQCIWKRFSFSCADSALYTASQVSSVSKSFNFKNPDSGKGLTFIVFVRLELQNIKWCWNYN